MQIQRSVVLLTSKPVIQSATEATYPYARPGRQWDGTPPPALPQKRCQKRFPCKSPRFVPCMDLYWIWDHQGPSPSKRSLDQVDAVCRKLATAGYPGFLRNRQIVPEEQRTRGVGRWNQ